jgi:hypothetical protein
MGIYGIELHTGSDKQKRRKPNTDKQDYYVAKTHNSYCTSPCSTFGGPTAD